MIRAQRQRAPRIRASGPVTVNVPASSTIYLLNLIWNGIKSLQRERGHQEWPS